MLRCIHCHQCGLRSAEKRWSSRASPATCTLCGKLSHVIASTRSGIQTATLWIAFACVILGAIGGQPLIGAIVGLPCAVAYNVWAWRRAEMFPIACASAATARRVGWLVNLLAVLGIFGS